MRSRIPGTHRRPRPSAPAWSDDGSPVAEGVEVHVGDARKVLPALDLDAARTVVVTDPPWPEAPPDLLATWGVTDCDGLVAEVLALCASRARRLVIVLGCSTDPRLLRVPATMPFVRVCWLRLALPSPRGTLLNSGDVAYVFGSREAGQGMTLLPGEITAHTARANEGEGAQLHPTARRLEHMRWLISHFTRPGDTVLDPFAGSGTTLLAARDAGRRAVGIEVHEPYMAGIRARFRQTSLVPIQRAAES